MDNLGNLTALLSGTSGSLADVAEGAVWVKERSFGPALWPGAWAVLNGEREMEPLSSGKSPVGKPVVLMEGAIKGVMGYSMVFKSKFSQLHTRIMRENHLLFMAEHFRL